MNEKCKLTGSMKDIVKNRGMGMKVKSELHERILVSRMMDESELLYMQGRERQEENVFEMKCLRSMVGLARRDRIANEVTCRRTVLRVEVVCRGDMSVLRGLVIWREFIPIV